MMKCKMDVGLRRKEREGMGVRKGKRMRKERNIEEESEGEYRE